MDLITYQKGHPFFLHRYLPFEALLTLKKHVSSELRIHMPHIIQQQRWGYLIYTFLFLVSFTFCDCYKELLMKNSFYFSVMIVSSYSSWLVEGLEGLYSKEYNWECRRMFPTITPIFSDRTFVYVIILRLFILIYLFINMTRVIVCSYYFCLDCHALQTCKNYLFSFSPCQTFFFLLDAP